MARSRQRLKQVQDERDAKVRMLRKEVLGLLDH